MSNTSTTWWDFSFKLIQTTCALSVLGLAVYGVFFSSLARTTEQFFQASIASAYEENVDLRRQSRELEQKINDNRRIEADPRRRNAQLTEEGGAAKAQVTEELAAMQARLSEQRTALQSEQLQWQDQLSGTARSLFTI